MPRGQKTNAGEVVLKLRQIEVRTAQGKSLALACSEAAISEQSDSRWRKEYGGLQVNQARKMKDLERETTRLCRLVADLSLVSQALADVASGNLQALSDAGRRWRHLGEVRPLGTSRLPDRQPAPEHAALRAHVAGRRG